MVGSNGSRHSTITRTETWSTGHSLEVFHKRVEAVRTDLCATPCWTKGGLMHTCIFKRVHRANHLQSGGFTCTPHLICTTPFSLIYQISDGEVAAARADIRDLYINSAVRQ